MQSFPRGISVGRYQQQRQRRTGPARRRGSSLFPGLRAGRGGCFRPTGGGWFGLSLSCNSGRETSDHSTLIVPRVNGRGALLQIHKQQYNQMGSAMGLCHMALFSQLLECVLVMQNYETLQFKLNNIQNTNGIIMKVFNEKIFNICLNFPAVKCCIAYEAILCTWK